ncbi:glycerol-3-phosphate dehydrogenase/oxidase [Hoyosella sp. YIM 151337]|uniref:glycerol-3-phosphate dehydrogenase/oxidase n=1 Tax=Hoyosella sp. YIM 151337 TaxID=2992742 RepID=UPI0022358703|nr:glycerol-3-phosphate dehydrogenase/oxidase [Hoyosella sp. YIM 151337]MCW4353636.1 glycerol-3-phosphate dehydrogenase/oxidase [Hoyosella sp. YIM 151337]
MLTPVSLSPANRTQALKEMAGTELDVLVIGAGVVGAGAALDAASRGLRVGLVEARDYASGTSSRSSKLVHGGLRYLKQLEFPLVFEALRERALILHTLAPHLARPVPFLFPLQKSVIDRVWAGAGIGVYDVLGAGKGVPGHHRHLGRRKALTLFPGGKKQAIKGGILFYEGQLDDARHTLMLSRTAASFGAQCANSTRVMGFLRDGDRVAGAQVCDLETGDLIDIRARHVVNAAGVWTDEIQAMLGNRGQLKVHASKGVHIVVPRDRIDAATGLITETEKSLLFIIPCPWSDDFWVIGTTDTTWNLDLAHPAATSRDIEYILGQVNALLAKPLTRDDIVGVFAGLRPLLAGEADDSSTLSREHAVVSPAPGLTLVAGGKYTTYRVMAKDAIDAALRDVGGTFEPSRTETTPLVGAREYEEMWSARARLAATSGLTVGRLEHLLHRYGSAVTEVLELIAGAPQLAAPLPGGERYLKAEIVYAVTHEGALHLDDILARRTRVSIETRDRGKVAALAAAELVKPYLGWDTAAVQREIEHYHARVDAEIDSQLQADDHTADAARLGAPDVRAGARAGAKVL